jgi:DNA-directed RNA polymerase beta' subunit
MEYKFKKSNAEVKTIKAIQFGVMSPEFIKNISVTQSMEFAGREISKGINHDMCYDPATGQPNLGAINDPRMGNTNDQEHPGYCGHIEFVRPVYHIGFFKIVIDILRSVSYFTSELLVNRADYIDKKGRRNLKEITRLSKNIKKCPITQKKLPTYTKEGNKIGIDHGKGKEIISPVEVYSILEKISDEDAQILGLNTKYTRPEWLLLTTLCVPPPHVRPSVFMSSSQKCDDDLTTKLNEIVKTNLALTNAIEKSNQDQGSTNEHFISQLESLLQYNASTFIDNQHPNQPPSLQRSGKPLKTLRERLAGKDGRVRGNLMGKRVDYSARTVITADPNLSLDQVGIPKTIALNLTVPVVVTDFNKDFLLELVKRGPNVHPGAKFIIKTGGTKLDLKFAKITELKNGWIVERHLNDGDEVIFNRQPSLHKMSMMGHKAKILDGSTFRLNLAYTGAYNADFDGDEMNLHVPQSLTARAEVENLMMVDRMIVSPQSNKPVIGIIQDSLLSSCKMTRRNIFIKKDQLMNMIMLIDDWDHNIPKPAIIRNGVEYWTGKQVFSLILPKSLIINNVKDLMNPFDKGIHIHSGKIISGSVDKSVIGKSQGGLIHILFNDFGSGTTKVFLNQVQKLSNFWIKQSGFTVGVGDAVASKETAKAVNDILEATKIKIKDIIKNGNSEGNDPRIIEELINTELNAAVSEAGKKAEESLNFNNNFKATVSAGSKGSPINIAQILAVVGQQNVEGRRINYGFKHRTLPHYQKKDVGQESRGFVENNYLKGLTPQEFFYHGMAGREGLIDTACKTSEVGYIQRRLVKALEDVSVKYDNTVRNSRGLIIQFLYGEDGIDATYMENIHLKLLGYNQVDLEKIYFNKNLPEEFELIKQCQLDLIEIARCKELNNAKLDDDYYPMPVNVSRILKFAKSIKTDSDKRFSDLEIFEEVKELCQRIANIFIPTKDTIEYSEKVRSSNGTKLFRIYIISELSTNLVRDLNKQQLLYVVQDIELKFKKAIVNPGEMCGILAAQSIGELTTQLTLNSVDYNTTLVIDWTSPDIIPPCRPNDKIGKFIDSLIEKYPDDCQLQQDGHTIWLPLKKGTAKALSVDEDGNMLWTELEAVTRHLPINKDGTKTLLKVKTESGREAICTKAKSFLVYSELDKKIIPKEGSDLVIGDLIPIVNQLKSQPFRTSINLKTIMNPRECVFTDYMIEAKNIINIANKTGPRTAWFHLIKDRVPYNRGDTLRVAIERAMLANGEINIGGSIRSNDVKTTKCVFMFEPGMIYSKSWGKFGDDKTVNGIPSEIKLDREFGFLIGAYLAEGFSTQFQLGISNNNENYRKMATAWATKLGISNRLNTSTNEKGQIGTSILMHSTILRNFITEICGIGSYKKRVPEFAFSGPDQFAEGILDGYLCGDGCVHMNGNISAVSRSKELRDGIGLLLTRFEIVSKLSSSELVNKKDKKDPTGESKPIYNLYICVNEISKFQNIITAIDYKQDRTLKNINRIHNKQINNKIYFKYTILDPVISIEEFISDYEFVYDLTVEKTRTMFSVNGMGLDDSFHYAGVSAKNVTLGVPRLKELINITKKLKTPSLTMYEKDLVKDLNLTGQKRIVEGIRSSLEYKTLQDIIKSSDIIYSDDQEYSDDDAIVELYKELYEYTDSPFSEKFLSLRLQFNSKDLEYVDTSLLEISKLLEHSIGNGHKIICSDDNTELDKKENLFIRIICADASNNNEKEQMVILRKIEVFCMFIKIKGYEGIDRVYTKESKINKWTPEKGHYKEPQWILETEGSNLVDSMEVQSIDQTRTISNNVIEIYEVFGIEAARLTLLNELRNVLSFDGSYVNYRHLAVLVDTMTCRGSLTAMTRHGINRVADAGVLTKCSFEETVEILTDAAAFGEIDLLKGISDNIILGQTVPAGTGVMDIIYDTEMEPELPKVPAISREPTPYLIETYIPSEPKYEQMAIWNY